MLKIKRALISLSDKTGIKGLLEVLNGFGVEILSTGGTAKTIARLGIPVKDVSEYTGFPEMMNGRVKTLHPKIHGGLLALRDNKSHMKQAKRHGIGMIDMVVVNLYPFEKTVGKKNVTPREAIENIDIGGPAMLRSAAKNYKSAAVITNPSRYAEIITELKANKGTLSDATLKSLACEVFKRTSGYDNAIANYLCKKTDEFPETLCLGFKKLQDLRYGENPHQGGAFYKEDFFEGAGICNMKKLQGKELSFNNIMDLDAAVSAVREFDKQAAVIIKHMNPCGVAAAGSLSEAYLDALECDRLSAFGSVVGFNGKVDGKVAATVMKEADFIECIIAPYFVDKAKNIFSKKKNLRILAFSGIEKRPYNKLEYKQVKGGLLLQEPDFKKIGKGDLKIVTKKRPTKEEMDSLLFAWKVVKHVKSNAIVLCNGTKTVGIGAGQPSRVDSVIIACRKAKGKLAGAVLASDGFFPKKDSIDEAHKAGIKAVIQPGGSIRDKEVIDACNELGVSMVFTGFRHFKH